MNRTDRRRSIVMRGDERRMRRYFYIGIRELRAAGTPIDLRGFRLAMLACRKVARAGHRAAAKEQA